MRPVLLYNATIVTSEKEAAGSVIISDGRVADVIYNEDYMYEEHIRKACSSYEDIETVNLEGKHLMAGGIDAHVHFRDPGLTHKADIHTESQAAAAGGVTTVIDMPNTSPATVSAYNLKQKAESAKGRSLVNIGFHIGVTNSNAEEIERLADGEYEGISKYCGGVKVFMGSSTGNMLVDDSSTLDRIFGISRRPVLVHCEDEDTIRRNMEAAKAKYGDEIPFSEHDIIRSRKACIISSIKALEKAISHGTGLVLCHISTKEEIEMVRAAKLSNPSIVAETSCNYLWFTNEAYERLGSKAKCNPAIKTDEDRRALRAALADGIIDTIGSDHAPHLLSEKEGPYTKAPSGLPTIQQSLPVLLTIAAQEDIPLTRIASVFSEKAADMYGLRRGKVKAGYAADIVIFDKDAEYVVRNEDQHGKCRWTPYDGETLKGRIETVYVNGIAAVTDGKAVADVCCGEILTFN